MINMFSFSFILILFSVFGVNGQIDSFNTYSSNNFEKNSRFGPIQPLNDNRNRELSSSSQSLSQSNQDQTPLISCYRVRANIKNAHPTDNTKYFMCRNEQRYEIFTCSNGGIFDDKQKACIDLCEQKKPCLNQGQCIILANLTLECVCRQDWTGERCEIPLSTCVNQPCGPNAECRMLKAIDYPQDYVCICNNHQSYGRNCQQTVPNPCLANLQQFHPFAFSRRAYINCDDEIIFFQPCNALLYWDQEEKRCDRSLPDILRSPFMNIKPRNEQKYQTQPSIVKPTQWQNDFVMQPSMTNQQWKQNYLPTVSQSFSNQQWSNQIPDTRTQTNQRFSSQSQSWQGQNQPSLTNTFIETTTEVPRVFHLQGFSNQQSREQQPLQRQNNANNQIQGSEDFKTQSGSNQLISNSFETTTTTASNKEIFMGLLHGWQSN